MTGSHDDTTDESVPVPDERGGAPAIADPDEGRSTRENTDPDGYEVPRGEPAERCAHCGAPFTDDQLLALHRGLEHAGDLSEDERDAYEQAREAEAESIRLFRLQALAVLVVLYFGLLITYSVVT